jgi:hypothetical protein
MVGGHFTREDVRTVSKQTGNDIDATDGGEHNPKSGVGNRARATVKWLNTYRKQLAVVSLSVLGATASAWVGIRFDWWRAGIVVLAVAIVATVSPIVFHFLV